MINGLEPHKLNLRDRDWKCFKYLCEELKISPSEKTRELIENCLKENEGLILQAIENQKIAIEKRNKK